MSIETEMSKFYPYASITCVRATVMNLGNYPTVSLKIWKTEM
jgi:hypothetical protein